MIKITPQIRGIVYTMIMVCSLIYSGYSWGIGQCVFAFIFFFLGMFTYIRFLRADKEMILEGNY